jgi:hypothetical protein
MSDNSTYCEACKRSGWFPVWQYPPEDLVNRRLLCEACILELEEKRNEALNRLEMGT